MSARITFNDNDQLWVRVETIADAAGFGFDPVAHWEVIVSHPVRYEPGTEDDSGEGCYDRHTTDLFRAFDRRLLAAGYRYIERRDEDPNDPESPGPGEFHIYEQPA